MTTPPAFVTSMAPHGHPDHLVMRLAVSPDGIIDVAVCSDCLTAPQAAQLLTGVADTIATTPGTDHVL